MKIQFAMPMSNELVEQLERIGLPSAVVCTAAFEATSRAMVELQVDKNHPLLVTGYPIAKLTKEPISQRTDQLADQVAQRLLVGRAVGKVV